MPVPLPLRLVASGAADRIVPPARDAADSESRRAEHAAGVDSFLRVTGRDSTAPSAATGGAANRLARDRLAANRAALDRLVALGLFGPAEPDRFVIYRITAGDRSQTGVVCGIRTADFANGRVRAHEQIHPERAADLADYYAEVGVQSNPIVLAHQPAQQTIDIVRAIAARRRADVTVTDRDAAQAAFIRQEIWAVDDETEQRRLAAALAGGTRYLIDGHHRAAAAIASAERAGPGSADLALCVIFPAAELTNLPHHRSLRHPDGPLAILRHLEAITEVRPVESPGTSIDGDELLLRGATTWWSIRTIPSPGDAPALAVLDPFRLERLVARIRTADPAFGDRLEIRYLPGGIDLGTLATTTDRSSELLVAMRPVAIDQLLAVADAGLTMPPKSTYFVPKLRSGLFVRQL